MDRDANDTDPTTAIMTELVRGMDDADLRGLIHDTPESEWKTIDQGAATLVVAGFDPALDGMPPTPVVLCL